MTDKYFFLKPCKYIAIFLAMGMAHPAIAQIPDKQKDTVTDMFSCREIESDEARLVCYDKSVGRFEDANTSGEIVTITRPEVEKIKKDAFGFNVPAILKFGNIFSDPKDKHSSKDDSKKDRKNKNKREHFSQANVTLSIIKTQKFGYEKTRFYLEGGQVWEQIESKSLSIRKKTPGKAHIVKAALGSFLLRINGKGQAVRVKRIK